MNTAADVTTEIITQIASRKGVDPWELDEPLQHVLDTDAFDALVSDRTAQQSQNNLRIQFVYEGYLVTAEGPTQVVIEEHMPSDVDGEVNATRTRPD